MANKKLNIVAFLLLVLATTSICAQEVQTVNRNAEKIKGSRFIPYPNYTGSPFLNPKFLMGEIELADGTKVGNMVLNYGTYRDELIYYNSVISTQIVVDKISLNGFSFTDLNGVKRVFRRLFYDGYFKGDCYFEVLSSGNISLLASRKVTLEACDTYYSKSGMAYQSADSYYLYSPSKGYFPLNINRNSLLSKFSKPDQKLIRKTLRKNGVYIIDEPSFVTAWNLLVEKKIEPAL